MANLREQRLPYSRHFYDSGSRHSNEHRVVKDCTWKTFIASCAILSSDMPHMKSILLCDIYIAKVGVV